MDQLTAMRVFSAVVETGNFTRAAVALTMPKATVTTMIKALEAHLGTNLLDRTTRRVAPTPAGTAYYQRARDILSMVDMLDHEVSGSVRTTSGRLRVEMSGGLADHVVLPRLDQFRQAHPGIVIDLGVGDRFVDYMTDQVDCAVRIGKPTDPSLVIRRIGAVGMATYAAPGLVARQGAPDHPRDLERQHRCIAYRRPGTAEAVAVTYRRGSDTCTVTPAYSLSVSDSRSAVIAGIAGLGILQTSPFMARRAVAQEQLVPVLGDWACDDMPLYLAHAGSRRVSMSARLFMDWLVCLFGEDAGSAPDE